MKIEIKQALILIVFGLFFASIHAQENSAVKAYFDAGILNEIVSEKNCVGLRFYNAIDEKNPSEITVMVIGIRDDGSEISGGLFSGPKYKLAEGISDGRAVYEGISKSKAKANCEAIKAKGMLSFSASFSAKDISDMLGLNGASGILIVELSDKSNENFSAQASNLKNGTPSTLGGTEALISTEPCPTICGDSGNYLNR